MKANPNIWVIRFLYNYCLLYGTGLRYPGTVHSCEDDSNFVLTHCGMYTLFFFFLIMQMCDSHACVHANMRTCMYIPHL